MTFEVLVSDSPSQFYERGVPWLERREDHHNLLLGLAAARSRSGSWAEGDFFATVEHAGAVVGCVVRIPPHKALLTELPPESAPFVAAALAERFEGIPAAFGPRAAGEAVAKAWCGLRGLDWVAGMPYGLYRLDRVNPVAGAEGSMRAGRTEDAGRAVSWGEAFSRDTGIVPAPGSATVQRWIESQGLFIWERDGEPVSMAVAQGRSGRGVRVGYVYTPDEERGRGFASALVAALSQAQLDSGLDFCILYTDLTNPTSNAIYQRIGYELIGELSDFDFLERGT